MVIDHSPYPVLDQGFIRLIDVMGDDAAIEEAARVSVSGDGVRTVQDRTGLIRYLLRHFHTTPFEMVSFKVHVKLPIFVERQWIRHRTGKTNEMSARYSELPEQFYVPKPGDVQYQATKNKQGRGSTASDNVAQQFIDRVTASCEEQFDEYRAHLGYGDEEGHIYEPGDYSELVENGGIARELARIGLPLNTYTEKYWKCDLWNLMNFMRLRLDSHAQYEVRAYAEVMYTIAKQYCPIAMEAFDDFIKNAVRLTAVEVEWLKAAIGAGGTPRPFPTKREREEWLVKAATLGIPTFEV